MPHCGFIETPAITPSLDGNSNHWSFMGIGVSYAPTKNSFKMYLDTHKGLGIKIVIILSWIL